jgi:hypothetical protein
MPTPTRTPAVSQAVCARPCRSEPERLTFVGLRCGKGRALAVASERPVDRILGIELAPSLIAIAKGNSQAIERVHPQRTTIEVSEGDASAASLPAGDLAIFLFHSFGCQLVQRLVGRIVDLGNQADREIFFIYENPVYAGMVDETKRFTKRFEAVVPCTPEEQGFAPDDFDKIAVWQCTGQTR